MQKPIVGGALGELVRQSQLGQRRHVALSARHRSRCPHRYHDRRQLAARHHGQRTSVRQCFAKSDRRFHCEDCRANRRTLGNLSIRIERMVHGNVKVCSIDSDFVHGADYKVPGRRRQHFQRLVRRRRLHPPRRRRP